MENEHIHVVHQGTLNDVGGRLVAKVGYCVNCMTTIWIYPVED